MVVLICDNKGYPRRVGMFENTNETPAFWPATIHSIYLETLHEREFVRHGSKLALGLALALSLIPGRKFKDRF